MAKSGVEEFNYQDGVSLKEYVDTRFASVQRAIDKAETTLNTRLEGMNEFREAMKDQAVQMATKEDIRGIRKEIDELKRAANVGVGKADQASVDRANTMAFLGLLLAVIAIVVRFF